MASDDLTEIVKKAILEGDDLTRWVTLGILYEQSLRLKGYKRPRGRPKKPASKIQSLDAWRAFILWNYAQKLSVDARSKVSNRELIAFAAKVEGMLSVPNQERAFPPGGDFESSISRGKSALEIDKNWTSALCEEIARI